MMIEINNISKSYGSFQVLKNCSASIARGEVVVICGPSGSGKSTLIKTVNGLETIDSGEINVSGFRLAPGVTNVAALRRSIAAAEEKARSLLARVGLSGHIEKYPAQLSGGQQQRVAIARALALDPEVMLFDEPTSALDPEMVNEVLDVMTGLARQGMTMVCVTHEMGFARSVANRILFMDEGEIVETADAAKFFDDPQSDRARSFLAKILKH
jgi:ABC-type polar amino acid transport system ATPase subunit